jgi:hypothetical protein
MPNTKVSRAGNDVWRKKVQTCEVYGVHTECDIKSTVVYKGLDIHIYWYKGAQVGTASKNISLTKMPNQYINLCCDIA